MAKQSRHQSIINRHSDGEYSDDHWLREFENKLQSSAVQPRGPNLYDQISSIMNTKSKYPSVQAAVDDMMHRSGLTTYLSGVKESQEKIPNQKASKTAQTMTESKADDGPKPKILQKIPGLELTLHNIMQETKGNLPISAIIRRLQAMYSKDSPDEKMWDEEDFLRWVSNLNLEAKKNNPGVFDNYSNLGKGDHSAAEADIDASNTDAFNILMPAKVAQQNLSNAEVLQLQKLMNKVFEKHRATLIQSFSGSMTPEQIDAQRLKEDGILGPKTQQSLNNYLKTYQTNDPRVVLEALKQYFPA